MEFRSYGVPPRPVKPLRRHRPSSKWAFLLIFTFVTIREVVSVTVCRIAVSSSRPYLLFSIRGVSKTVKLSGMLR